MLYLRCYRGGGDPEGIKVTDVLMVEQEILGVEEVMVGEDVVVVVEGLVADGRHSEELTRPVQHSAEFASGVVNWP